MNITIKTIPHKEQRYPTVGDWIVEGDDLTILVSELGDWRSEMAVAYHELREALLCKYLGITQGEVDEFDLEYEKIRRAHPEEIGDQEPGDQSHAPYYLPHQYATRDERLLLADLGVSWEEHEITIVELEDEE